jgi:BirA family biotin operon repressor/biotin-[acetyl-CoA-carboxylase] ligase
MISVETVQSKLKTSTFGKKILAFETIDSTNNCARAISGDLTPEGTVVVAESQTSGRGRLGRSWSAEAGANLTFSIVLRPGEVAEGANLLPLLAAVAVSRAVREVTGQETECKWPNDLLIHGKKFCGILLEAEVTEEGLSSVIAGIGINVNQMKFPPEFADRATSLKLVTGKTVERERLLRSVLEHFETLYRSARAEHYREIPRLWVSTSRMVGSRVEVETEGRILQGRVEGIAQDGGLRLLTASGERTLYAGDVSILKGI